MAAHTHPHKQVKDVFTQPVLDKIAATIAEVEKHTSASIRVSIKEERDHDEAGLTVEDIAKREFLKLGMDKTSGRNGILLFILFEEHKFYVFGDEGIHKRVNPETWKDVAATLKEHFIHGAYEEGIHDALRKILKHVHTSFAHTGGENELSNEVVIG
ncbi:MAG: TPM domain-containing protein [Bacteroidota bacterium]|nr:TPM domain-containing protein [Bacteroidota bacterium]MDP4230847.1 TPM domain-containing protein [Bacteroidota bacterium]MDP4235659.1 TPM domain-containing protein [Bacteroidota bacterium]